MAKQLSTVDSDKRSKTKCVSFNLEAPKPINPQTRFSFNFRLGRDQEDPRKNRITEEEIGPFSRYVIRKENDEQAQDSCMFRTKNPPEFLSSELDVSLDSYSFVEEPVKFQFEDDYGDRLFVDLKREVICRNVNAATSNHGSTKYCFGDEDSMAMESDMTIEFLDSLF